MSELTHKERTLQDIIDEMTPEQRETMDLVVGAAVEDEVIDDDTIVARAEALPLEQRQLIDFLVGSVLDQQESASLEQSNLRVNNFLEHYGVKGMKWGVRKRDLSDGQSRGGGKSAYSAPKGGGVDGLMSVNTKENRSVARAKVRAGNATAQEAHLAALKSTGHRVANAFLGDKSYWRGMATTVGIGGAVIGASLAAPALLPASALGVTSAAVLSGTTSAGIVGIQVSGAVLQVTNIIRAVQGNQRIYESYSQLGNNIANNYQAGMKRTAKILRKDGGLSSGKSKKALKQSNDLRVNNFLEHHLTTPVAQMQAGA